jgi:hypothetical protein
MSLTRVTTMTAVLLIGIAMGMPGLRTRRVSAQNFSAALTGSYGFTATAPYALSNPDPTAIVGVLTFDGAGNLTGNEREVSPDTSPNATAVRVQTVSFTGTYTLNGDGTGSLTIQTGGTVIPVSFVMTDSGSNLMFVPIGSINIVLTGTARKQ